MSKDPFKLFCHPSAIALSIISLSRGHNNNYNYSYYINLYINNFAPYYLEKSIYNILYTL